ncbi:MAG TPA: CxxxxCH/CxxCH domain-containing protein [Nitrospirota bacterium]|nr:CxxxxCH/CxxCH domain-containing protein [Nitrospirota bacterium]
MAQRKKNNISILILLVLLILVGGCSSQNENYPFAGGSHPPGWLPAGHMIAAKTNIASCSECHGSDFLGGISRVSCTSCHIGSATSVHPSSWGTGTQLILNHAPYVAANNSTSCQNAYCHGSDLSGVTGSGPGCKTCHLNGAFPFLPANCSSCHGNPPSGTVYPNIASAHNTATGHFAPMVALQDGCNTCHLGAGSGTVNHFNGIVDIQLMSSVYSAKSGTAVNNPDGSCSNVSCHGGQTTPIWGSGSIDVNSSCTSCHAYGSSQYNSYLSGEHYSHIFTEGYTCTDCHDTTKLATNHFKQLNTSIMEGPASATIYDSFNYNGSCSPGCHETRIW